MLVRLEDSVRVSLNHRQGDPRWYRVSPIPRDYSNYEHCGDRLRRPCVQPIHYRLVEIAGLRGRHSFSLKEVPALHREGTHTLRVEPVVPRELEFSSTRKPAGIEIVIRRDDSYVGYVSELKGLPFILWPRSTAHLGHQTDARVGADCVAVAIYGRRRMGQRLPYMAPRALHRYTRAVPDGRIQAGDILHFGFQTAVLSEDTTPLGRINPGDRVIHAYHELVEERPFGELPYKGSPFVVRRWQ